jgi:hypothetical protein
VLILNGLRIAACRADEPAAPGADLVWRTRRVGSLPAEPEAGNPIAIVRAAETASGAATDHIFGYDGRVRCRFRIDPDGTAASCDALPEVSERDLFSLFAEPVMRTILVRRGLLSFHAAALARSGSAILIMAPKGAGKSTLSWSLQSRGWQLLADDLARVEALGGGWTVFPGHRQTKLTPEAAFALGQSADDMPLRFDDPGPAWSAASFDKRVIDPADGPEEPSGPVPLAACVFLTPRDAGAVVARVESLSPSAAVRHLLSHATPDPLGNAPAVPPRLQRALGGLATQVGAVALTLPDAFDRLAAAATALESLVEPVGVA